jgi:hypothetical protein
MALGPNLTTVEITGSYVDFEGNPIEGQIRFSIAQVLRNGTDDQLVAPSSVVVPLVAGSFSVLLPATNDPDVVPNPFVYTVEESFPRGRSYQISIPFDTVGSLDLADISPDPILNEAFVAAISQSVWNPLESNIAALDVSINQTTDKFLASGKYWYIEANYGTYTALNTAYPSYSALNAATYSISGDDIASFVTSAQGYAASASASATTAQNNAAGTINPLLLIGG